MKAQQAPLSLPPESARQAARSVPVQTASMNEELQERRNDDVEEVEHHQRQDRVEGAGKEVFPNPGDGAAGQIGRRQRIHLLGADETGHIDGGAHRISYRSTIATRRL